MRIFDRKLDEVVDRETYVTRNFISVLFTKFWGYQRKEDQMNRTFSMHKGDEKCVVLNCV
jgi:hypothetical protein